MFSHLKRLLGRRSPETFQGSDGVQMQGVTSRGGDATFAIPADWKVGQEGNGLICYHPGDGRGALRLHVLTFKRKAATPRSSTWLDGEAADHGSAIDVLGNGARMAAYTKSSVEDGVPITQRYWLVELVEGDVLRAAIFSFCVDTEHLDAKTTTDDFAMLEREVARVTFRTG